MRPLPDGQGASDHRHRCAGSLPRGVARIVAAGVVAPTGKRRRAARTLPSAASGKEGRPLADERPTNPPGLAELEHDAVRLERHAYQAMIKLVEEYPPTRDALHRWLRVREERLTTQVRLDVLLAAKAARERGP